MEQKEFNPEIKAEINKRFEDLFKYIGPNRQQLFNKVSLVHRDLNKELSKAEVTTQRHDEMLAEVKKVEKIAAQQLPHHLQPPSKKEAAPKKVSSTQAKTPAKAAAKKAAPKKK